MLRRLALLLSPMIVLVSCSPGPVQRLGDRFQTGLTPQLADGKATLQRLPDGVQVTLSDDALFMINSAELSDPGKYVLASVVQSLLAPTILQIDVSESPATPPNLQQARVDAITKFLKEWQLDPTLKSPISQQTIQVQGDTQATAITVRVIPEQS